MTRQRRRLLIGASVAAALAGVAVAIAAAIGVTSATLGTASKTLSSTQTCNLTSSSANDAQTNQESASQNIGDPNLIVVVSRTGHAQEGWLYFDFSACSFPANSNVVSATLSLAAQGATSHVIGVYKVSTTWSKSSITWNNQPSPASTATATANFNNTSYKTFDVSSDVADFVDTDAANGGWMIQDTTSNSSTQNDLCGASNGSSSCRPKLTITYNY